MIRLPEPLRTAFASCLAGAAVALVALTLAGRWRAGLALALGLVVGSLNGLMAKRALESGVDFRFTSIGRLSVLTAAGIGIGFVIGVATVPLVIGGIALAQLALAGVAAVHAVRAARR